tara:strand:+ start:617 stop:802 length:186 start_codon:yes stop_codon:yes gene_type:complete
MSKSMQVPVLVFEKHKEVEMLMEALHSKKEYMTDGTDKQEADKLLHELYKINKIYEKTNNS